MPSDRKVTANRNNAKKSTGPRSVAGREAARRNARRHGLAVAIGGDPAFHEDIEKLAKALSLSSGTQQVSEHAREAPKPSWTWRAFEESAPFCLKRSTSQMLRPPMASQI